jgi:transcriptional regulator with XRE-family HTH domain
MKLIEMVKQLQKAEGLNDSEFAAKLKFSRGQWNRIKNGGTFGIKFLRNLQRIYPGENYPGLKKEIDIFLFSDLTNCNK